MFQSDIAPIQKSIEPGPAREAQQQRRVSALRVFGISTFVPKMLQKIFDKRLHHPAIVPGYFALPRPKL